MKAYLGIDVGSVTTKFAVLDSNDTLIADLYTRTMGRPIQVVQEGLRQMADLLPPGLEIASVGATGSARQLTGVIVGADTICNLPVPILIHAGSLDRLVSDSEARGLASGVLYGQKALDDQRSLGDAENHEQ